MESTRTVTVFVRDRDRFVQVDPVDEWDATTLLGAVSSDPRSFHELGLAWSRYRPDQALVEMPWRDAEKETPQGEWFLIDLACQQLVATDGELLSETRASYQRDDGKWNPEIPIVWFNFAPWWQCKTATRLEEVLLPVPPWVEPVGFREALFGRAMAQSIADRMLAIAANETIPDLAPANRDVASNDTVPVDWRRTSSRWYVLTKRVHIDWLMSPCKELDGRLPRSFLHHGRDWVDGEIEHRSREWTLFKRPPQPLDRDTFAYRHGPMGLDEVVVYFDFCRELIPWGWRQVSVGQRDRNQLVDAIYRHGQHWLDHGEIEGDEATPRAIIECSRRHMPRVSSDMHTDCDCPLCRMLAEENSDSSPMFTGFDGHHLELDDEFAFSLCETEEEWRQQQVEFGSIEMDDDEDGEENDDLEDETIGSGARMEADPTSSDNPGFSSVWKSSYVAEGTEGIPGLSTLALGFRLTEIISDLQARPGTRKRIRTLNTLFDAMRAAVDDDVMRKQASEAMKVELEDVAAVDASMTSKIADLESQIDAWSRLPR